MYTCANCKVLSCKTGDFEKMPKNCPIRETDKEKMIQVYKEKENFALAYNAARLEAEGYGKLSRLEELIVFAKKNKFKNLGLAFCVGLKDEAQKLQKILSDHDFIVNSIICKNGSISKEFLGIKNEEQVRPNTYEVICNPIGQALFLNKEETELNILLGLCVGHDSLFIKYSDAPITIFAVKDRVLAHNPLGAIYCSHSYYKNKLKTKA